MGDSPGSPEEIEPARESNLSPSQGQAGTKAEPGSVRLQVSHWSRLREALPALVKAAHPRAHLLPSPWQPAVWKQTAESHAQKAEVFKALGESGSSPVPARFLHVAWQLESGAFTPTAHFPPLN